MRTIEGISLLDAYRNFEPQKTVDSEAYFMEIFVVKLLTDTTFISEIIKLKMTDKNQNIHMVCIKIFRNLRKF